jgi:hypothetical protein
MGFFEQKLLHKCYSIKKYLIFFLKYFAKVWLVYFSIFKQLTKYFCVAGKDSD